MCVCARQGNENEVNCIRFSFFWLYGGKQMLWIEQEPMWRVEGPHQGCFSGAAQHCQGFQLKATIIGRRGQQRGQWQVGSEWQGNGRSGGESVRRGRWTEWADIERGKKEHMRGGISENTWWYTEKVRLARNRQKNSAEEEECVNRVRKEVEVELDVNWHYRFGQETQGESEQ